MSKKDFKVKGGFSSLIDEEPQEVIKKKRTTKSVTFIIEKSTHEKIRTIAFLEDIKLSHVVDRALLEYVNCYEDTHGKLKAPKQVVMEE